MSGPWRRAAILSWWAVAFSQATAWAAPSALCTAVCAEKAPGVCAAPAYVHVDCTGTTDSDPNVRPFHDLRYRIGYGDGGSSGAGIWAYSGMPKNSDAFPIGAHVYEQAGSFDITVIVTDSLGVQSTDVESVSVVAEDAAWTAAHTRCVSSTGSFSGCPAGVTDRVMSSDYDTSLRTAAGERTLFRCGEGFVASVNPALADATANGSLIGGFGSCADNPVEVTWGYDGPLHAGSYGVVLAGWRFRDISYRNTLASASGAHALGLVGGTVPNDKVLLLRAKSLDVAICGGTVGMLGTLDRWNDLFAAVDFECRMSKFVFGWPLALASFRRGALLGVRYSQEVSTGSTLGWRGMSFEKSLFAHNFWRGTNQHASLTVHFRTCAPACATREDAYNVIAYNRLHDDSAETFRTLALLNFNDSTQDQRKHDYVVEGNRFSYGSSTEGRAPQAIQLAGVHRVSVRNNLVDYRGLAPVSGRNLRAISVLNDTSAGVAEAVANDVYNNTVIAGQSESGSPLILAHLAQGSGHRARNNLGFEANRNSGGSACDGSFTCSNNALLYRSIDGCPFRGQDNACTLSAPDEGFDFGELQIRSSGGSRDAVVDRGFPFPDSPSEALVYTDASGNCRVASGRNSSIAIDIGAYEFSAVPCDRTLERALEPSRNVLETQTIAPSRWRSPGSAS